MHRVVVLLLAALDALIAAAVGVALALAPLTLLWVFALPGADWAQLWPAAAAVWQLGHVVPVSVALPDAYVVQAGLDPAAATFVLSLAPLAFAAITTLSAARSGARAVDAGAWPTGVIGGVLAFGGASALVALTAHGSVATTETWQAILYPTAFSAAGLVLGVVGRAWSAGDEGPIDALHDRVDRLPAAWAAVPSLAVRGAALAVTAIVGAGALALAVSLVVRAPDVVSLTQEGNVDALGSAVLAIAQLAYLPTLVVWAVAFLAGPGFAIGAGTAVSPAGTHLGVVPGIPVLGILPDSSSTWALALVLVPVAAGAFAGWVVRSRSVRMLRERDGAAAAESYGALLVTTVLIAAIASGAAALLALLASGSFGPGRLAEVGPSAGPVALAIGVEVAVGAGILLLSPRRRDDEDDEAGPRPSSARG